MHTIKTNNKEIKQFVLLVLTKVLYSYIYVNIIFPMYSYYGFENDFSILRCMISWIVFIPLALGYVYLAKQNGLSKQIVGLFFAANFLPCLVLYEYMRTPFFILLCLYYLMMFIASQVVHFDIKGANETSQGLSSEFVINIVALILSAIVLFIWAYYAKFHIQLDLGSVYSIRYAAREYNIPTIFKMARSIAKGVIPLFAVYKLYQKKYIFACFLIFVQFAQFCIDGTKAVLFTMVLGILAFYLIKKGKDFIQYVPHGLSFLSISAIAETKIVGSYFISETLIRRAFFIPALLNYYFYEYFGVNGFDYYRQSILNRLIGRSAYSLTLAQEIGLHYFGRASFNGNNGLFSDAYANLGVAGIIIMPFLIIFFFELLRNAAGDLPPEVWAMCIISAYYTFTGSPFFTVLFGHGLIVMCILLYFLRRQRDEHENNSNIQLMKIFKGLFMIWEA